MVYSSRKSKIKPSLFSKKIDQFEIDKKRTNDDYDKINLKDESDKPKIKESINNCLSDDTYSKKEITSSLNQTSIEDKIISKINNIRYINNNKIKCL